MAVSGWRRLSEETVYEGDRVMARWRFRRADGGEAEFDITLHPGGVCVLALTPTGHVVLTREFRPGPDRVQWDLPGGFLEGDEEPIEGARRELAEETGYQGELRVIGALRPDAYSTEVRHVFLASGCRRTSDVEADQDEDIRVQVASVGDLRALLRAGEVTSTDAAYLALDAAGLL